MIRAVHPIGFVDPGLPAIRLGAMRHPRDDPRLVNLRWLAAITMLAIASGALLGGVLQAALHRVSKLRAPEIAQAATGARLASTADGRAARIRPRNPSVTVTAPSPLSVHPIASAGLSDRPLTVVVADLAHMSVLDRALDTPTEAPPPAEAHDQARPPAPTPGLMAFGTTRNVTPPAMSGDAARLPMILAEPGPLGTALNVTIRPASGPCEEERRSVLIAQRGDTIGRLLRGVSVTAADVGEIRAALGVGALAGGETLTVTLAPDPAEDRGKPPIVSLQRPSGGAVVAALADDGHYRQAAARDEGRDGDALRQAAGLAADAGDVDDASLKDSLDALAGHEGMGRPLVGNVIRILGTDRDLGEAVSARARIEVLFGAASGDSPDQELAYAALSADGRVTRLYRYAAADDNSVDYYDESGHSLSKFLLRKPVANGRLGDGFGWRIHPVLGDRRFHEGVDYAAPYGSPIVAAGAGVIEKIDYEGGYGKYIRIRHDLGYETTYAHVAGYPRGIAVGRRVQQGETIAYIGSTGLSTGPHLYYEVKINDRNVDPLRIKIAAGRILDGPSLAAFQRRRERIDALLKASRGNS